MARRIWQALRRAACNPTLRVRGPPSTAERAPGPIAQPVPSTTPAAPEFQPEALIQAEPRLGPGPGGEIGISTRFSELELDLTLNPPTPVLRADPEPADGATQGDTATGWQPDEAPTFPEPEEPDWRQSETPGTSGSSGAREAVEAPSELHATPAKPEPPSFVKQARKRAFWAAPPMRAGLWLAILLLAAGLIGQWLVSQRDWLAARHPSLQPVLATLCQPLGCRIEPYRLLKAITIDGSGFNRIDATRFRLSLSLRNSSDLPVATPDVELTLADGTDQVLVRRILRPQDLGAPASLAPHGSFDGERTLTVSAQARPDAIANYRVVAFYP